MADSTNYGMLNNMAQGIREGLIQYQTMKNNNRQNQMFNLSHGIQDGENGLEFTPEMQEKRQAEKGILAQKVAESQRAAREEVPDSPESKTMREFYKQYGQVPEGMSAAQLKSGSGIIGTGYKAEKASEAMEKRMGMMEERFNRGLDSKETMKGDSSWNNDKTMNTYIPRLDGAKKILNLITAARQPGESGVKSNQAVLGQLNAEISRLETGSQAPGLHSAEKTEMESSAAKLRNIYDTLSGKVSNVDLGDKFDQAEAMVKDLGRSYMNQIDDRAEILKATSNANLKEVYSLKHDQTQKRYRDRFGFWGDEKDPSRQQTKTAGQGAPKSGGFFSDIYEGGKGLLNRATSPAQASPQQQQPAAAPGPHPADDAMLVWAKANKNEPGAAEVLKANGVQ